MGVLADIITAPNRGVLIRKCFESRKPAGGFRVTLEESANAAFAWLCAAQDATGDGGVAGWYHLVEGWSTSYPETTGYIIPTFLRYATEMADASARPRAIQMAEWETAVQLPTGAVRSGVMSSRTAPAVFNTGQVLFGWTAAYVATGEERFAHAAQRAATWLCEQQDPDGAWRRNLSPLTNTHVQTYNVRSAWGLAVAGQAMNEARWVRAAQRNADWVLEQQQENGWFKHNTFRGDEDPLLHTIGYVLEGLVGLGELLNEYRYVAAARRGLQALVEDYQRTGVLKGRYDAGWRPSVKWRCLTGEAQIALVLFRLAMRDGDQAFASMAGSLLKHLIELQYRSDTPAESRGALSGSEPIWGAYCPWTYPNWAVKFLLDAVLVARGEGHKPAGEPTFHG